MKEHACAEPTDADASVLDRDRLRALAGLGGESFARELLETFLTESAGDLARLRQSANLPGAPRFVRIAHGVRIASQQIGAQALTHALLSLEQSARSLTVEDFLPARSSPGPLDRLLSALLSVEHELDRLRSAASDWLRRA